MTVDKQWRLWCNVGYVNTFTFQVALFIHFNQVGAAVTLAEMKSENENENIFVSGRVLPELYAMPDNSEDFRFDY